MGEVAAAVKSDPQRAADEAPGCSGAHVPLDELQTRTGLKVELEARIGGAVGGRSARHEDELNACVRGRRRHPDARAIGAERLVEEGKALIGAQFRWRA